MFKRSILLSFFFCLQAYADCNNFWQFPQQDCSTCQDQDYLCYPTCKRFKISAEYLFWRVKGSPVRAPLIVTAPMIADDLPLIGEPGTEILIGDHTYFFDPRSGGKITANYILDRGDCYQLEGSYFFLPVGSGSYTAFSSGSSNSIYLGVPYFNTLTNSESSALLAAPSSYGAESKLKIENRLQGAELNGIATLANDWVICTRINLLLGLRYLNFNERLTLRENRNNIEIPKEIFRVKDLFHTRNNFLGCQAGLTGEYKYGNFILNAKAKVAVGVMRQEVTIDGEFVTNAFNNFGDPQSFKGGYFALPSNIGHHQRTCATVVPEININVGYQFCRNLRLFAGYTVLYVDRMLWAGLQINRNINPTESALYQFTPDPVPVGDPCVPSLLRNSSFGAHGLNVGFEYLF